jgi:hypothetical protein
VPTAYGRWQKSWHGQALRSQGAEAFSRSSTRPAGSGPAGHPTWGFAPDVMGTYRLQLEYSDGVGFSEPVTPPPSARSARRSSMGW